MTSLRFKIGDTVTSRVAKLEVWAGEQGVILRAVGSKRYIVQFAATVVLMRGYELAHAAPLSEIQGQEWEAAREDILISHKPVQCISGMAGG